MSTSPIIGIPGIDNGTADGNTLRWEASQSKWVESNALVVDGAASGSMRIADDGNVLIKRTVSSVAASDLQIGGDNESGLEVQPEWTTDTTRIFAFNRGASWTNLAIAARLQAFYIENTERMRLNTDGRLSVGSTRNDVLGILQVYSAPNINTTAFINTGSATGHRYCSFRRSNTVETGSITQNGSSNTAYNTASDYRLKENEVPITDGLDRLLQLKTYRFNFIGEPERKFDGFFAHEVTPVVPEAITGKKDAVDENGDMVAQQIDQSKLVPLLVAAVQELEARVKELEGGV